MATFLIGPLEVRRVGNEISWNEQTERGTLLRQGYGSWSLVRFATYFDLLAIHIFVFVSYLLIDYYT